MDNIPTKVGELLWIIGDYVTIKSYNSKNNTFTCDIYYESDVIGTFCIHASCEVFGLDEEPVYEWAKSEYNKQYMVHKGTGLIYEDMEVLDDRRKIYYYNRQKEREYFDTNLDEIVDYESQDVLYVYIQSPDYSKTGIIYKIPSEQSDRNIDNQYFDQLFTPNQLFYPDSLDEENFGPTVVKDNRCYTYQSQNQIDSIINNTKFATQDFNGKIVNIYYEKDKEFAVVSIDDRPTKIILDITLLSSISQFTLDEWLNNGYGQKTKLKNLY